MGFNWKAGHGPEDFKAHFHARGAGGIAALQEILQHTVEDGADDVRHTIRTTPSDIVPGKDNRIWQRDMYDDVGYDPIETQGTVVKGRWGWVGNIEDYYKDQEWGAHYIPNPMHAIMQSFIKRREEFKNLLRDLMK